MSALPATLIPPRSDGRRGARPAAGQLSCDVATSIESLRSMQPEWDRIVEALGCGIYMSYDWCRVWWEHYAGSREARVFLFRIDDELVSVVPMFIDRVRLGPVHLSVAKIMGSDSTQAVCDLPVPKAWATAVYDRLLQQLIDEDGCDALAIGPLSEASGRIDALRLAAESRPDLVSKVHDRVVTQSTTIALPDSFDAYLASLSRNQRSNIHKGWRRLRDDFHVEVELITDPDAALAEFDEFVPMHARQWESRGGLGHFGDWPGAASFNRSLVSAMSHANRVRMLRVRADSCVIARQYSFTFGNTYHCRLAARVTDERWQHYGLGCLSLTKLFEHAIDEGKQIIDAGVGHYDYKLRLGGSQQRVRSILLAANRDDALRRAELFCSLAAVLDRAYYKLWFCRIAPRLPRRRRPLSRTWMRSRL